MNCDEFWNMTPRSFSNKLRGYIEVRNEEKRDAWDRTRWQIMYMVSLSPRITKGEKRSIINGLKFSWELPKAEKPQKMSEERRKYLNDRWDRQAKKEWLAKQENANS